MSKNHYFTGMGDKGNTIVGSKKIDKSDIILEAIGAVDELISYLSILNSEGLESILKEHITLIQNKLFSVNAEIVSIIDNRFTPKVPLKSQDILDLESYIFYVGEKLPPLKGFVLPGGNKHSAKFDMARAICRRTERRLVLIPKEYKTINKKFEINLKYINRLSSYLFWAARYVNMRSNTKESYPKI